MRKPLFPTVSLAGVLVVGWVSFPAAAAERPATGTYVYRGSSAGSAELASTGSPTWSAGAVEARIRPLAGASGSLGLVMHYQDPANHYLFLVSTNSTALMIYKAVGGSYVLLGSTPHLTLEEMLGNEYVLRGEDDGDGNLTILWDGVPQLTVTDETFSSGAVGLRAWAMTADFDDVRVEDRQGFTLFADDFEDGHADGWAAGQAWRVVESGPGGEPMPVPVLDTGFEGGNGELTFVDPQSWTIHVQPEMVGSSPYRAWFYFTLSNLSGLRPTTIVFQNVDFFTRPWYSYDRVHWYPLAGSGSTYSITFAGEPVWMAHSIPYLTSHLADLETDVAGPAVEARTLATSEGGRPVRVLRITAPGEPGGRCGVWLLARQHAWEASGSWVADGLVRWLTSGDPAAVELRHRAVVHVVPIVDVDNVVSGGSGKNQAPVDFNRDWRDAPYWRTIGRAIDVIEAMAAESSYDLFIDSHCPGSSGSFLAVQPEKTVSTEYWARFQEFRQRLAASTTAYTGSWVEWGASYDPLWYRMSFWHQYFEHPELELSLTLETAVGPRAAYRDLARGLGNTLAETLRCRPAH